MSAGIETKRLFIAIELPRQIRSRLGKIQKDLKKTGSDAKWVESDKIHLTMKFLGNVEISKMEAIRQCLVGLFKDKPRFPVTLRELGFFPAPSSARVLWAGIDDKEDQLSRMASLLDETLLKLGLEKEKRSFKPHVTLCRIRSPRNRIALLEAVRSLNDRFEKHSFAIDNVTLFESRLGSGGPTYAILKQIKFK